MFLCVSSALYAQTRVLMHTSNRRNQELTLRWAWDRLVCQSHQHTEMFTHALTQKKSETIKKAETDRQTQRASEGGGQVEKEWKIHVNEWGKSTFDQWPMSRILRPLFLAGLLRKGEPRSGEFLWWKMSLDGDTQILSLCGWVNYFALGDGHKR